MFTFFLNSAGKEFECGMRSGLYDKKKLPWKKLFLRSWQRQRHMRMCKVKIIYILFNFASDWVMYFSNSFLDIIITYE